MTALESPRRLHYAWVIAGVTFLTLLATAGIRSTPGVLMIPLEHEFGWDRATVSLAVSINLLLLRHTQYAAHCPPLVVRWRGLGDRGVIALAVVKSM